MTWASHTRNWRRLTGNLGVELNAIDRLTLVSDGSELRVLGCADSVESLWQIAKLVTVRHPHGHRILKALEELVDVTTEPSSLQIGMTVFPSDSSNNVIRVQAVGDFLQTVADSQNRDTEVEEGGVNVGSVLLIHRVGATRQNDALGLPAQIGQLLGAGKHLGVDIDLAETAGDEVGTAHKVLVRSLSHWDGIQLSFQELIVEKDILLRSIVQHQNGVKGIVGDHLGGRHDEDASSHTNCPGG